MPLQKNPDYTPVRINMLENAVENIGILEKSGVSDYTPFGMSMPESSWSLPDACNTYTSLYYDNMLDIDCWVDCGTWVPYGTSSFATCHTSQGYLQIGLYGNLTRGAYTEFDTETDSTYVMSMDITGYNTNCTWEVSVRDGQGNTIVAHTVTQTGTLNLEFTAVGSKSRVYVRRLSSTVTFGSFGLRTLSIDGKYHKEDVMYLSYRYGFNNMEKDDELKGLGNSYDFGARIYDPRVGRFLSIDPIYRSFPSESNFIFAGNNPVYYVDKKGEFKFNYTVEELREKYGMNDQQIQSFLNILNNIRELVETNQGALDALIATTGLTSEEILDALSFGEGPNIILIGGSQIWPGKDDISFGVDNIKLLHTSNVDSDVQSFGIAMLLLDELAHWGDIQTNGEITGQYSQDYDGRRKWNPEKIIGKQTWGISPTGHRGSDPQVFGWGVEAGPQTEGAGISGLMEIARVNQSRVFQKLPGTENIPKDVDYKSIGNNLMKSRTNEE